MLAVAVRPIVPVGGHLVRAHEELRDAPTEATPPLLGHPVARQAGTTLQLLEADPLLAAAKQTKCVAAMMMVSLHALRLTAAAHAGLSAAGLDRRICITEGTW